MQRLLLLLMLFSFSHALRGQSFSILKANADCLCPITIKDTVYGPTNPPDGFGTQLEIAGNSMDDPHYFESEHNTVWYKFRVKCSGQLVFDIIPEKITDDYDFVLYKYTGAGDFCDKVRSKELSPVRTCISRNDKSINSMTGLSVDAENEYIHSGVGEPYVKALPVKAGEWYYLLVDNVYSHGGGHTVKLRCSTKKSGGLYVGMKLNYGPINFTSESDTLMASSFEPLDSLIRFMETHPKVKVEIQGHVNAPLDDPSVRPWRGPQWLSDARA